MRIKYVGLKAVKKDNVAGTGLEWIPDQVHEVPDPVAAAKLLAYPLIWGLAEDKKPASQTTAPAKPADPQVADGGDGPADNQNPAGELTVEQVREALTQRGVRFHPNTGETKLRALLAGALRSESTEATGE